MRDAPGDRGAWYRKAMVDALLASGEVSSPRVAAALAKVPREAFLPPAGPDLASVYDLERALAVRRGPDGPAGEEGPVTSTISAPRVVGAMLELLALEEGMHVLEVGLGSGYNAALLREMVGPYGSVTSVDIDEGLVAETADRLAGAGYKDIELVTADGYLGYEAGAPFDRVVATVGCPDLSPYWLEQLSPRGRGLVPLQHADWHPLTQVWRADGEWRGRAAGNTGFLPLRGTHAGPSPWPAARACAAGRAQGWAPLGSRLASRLSPGPGDEGAGRARDLAFLVAMEDARAGFLGLHAGGSMARVDCRRGRVGWSGPAGPELAGHLVGLGHLWLGLGCPRAADYLQSFSLRGPGPRRGPGRVPAAPAAWAVDRVDHRQVLRLTLPGGG
jgi:protein-L-isoaspartate(D-aspartate) O-methyltransferase